MFTMWILFVISLFITIDNNRLFLLVSGITITISNILYFSAYYSLINATIFSILVKSFYFWYLFGTLVVGFVSVCFILKWELVFILFAIVPLVLSTLFEDCLPKGAR